MRAVPETYMPNLNEPARSLPSSLLDKTVAVVLIIQVTHLFAFLAAEAQIELTVVGIVSILILGIYCTKFWSETLAVLRNGLCSMWLTVLSIWPIATVIYADSGDLRNVGLHVFYGVLFLSIIVYAIRCRFEGISWICEIAFYTTVVGLVLSRTHPSLFNSMELASLADRTFSSVGILQDINVMDRGFGFYLQPNSAACALIIFFVLSHRSDYTSRVLNGILRSALLLAAVLFTGSRFFALVTLAILALFALSAFTRSASSKHLPLNSFRRTGRLPLFVILAAFVGLGSAMVLTESVSLQRIIDLGNLDALAEDPSLITRISVQGAYLNELREQPILGLGLGGTKAMYLAGVFEASSHNTYLEKAVQFGIPYTIAYFMCLLATARSAWRVQIQRTFGTNKMWQIFTLFFLAGFGINSILDFRPSIFGFGTFVALAAFPTRMLRNLPIQNAKVKQQLSNRK